MPARPDTPPPPPVVQRLRLRYARRGRLRFASHRDFQRALERALRRAGVPVGFSAGFSPHPKVSYLGAAPTGAASEAEYLEIGLAEPRDPEAVRRDLDAALPDGLDLLEVVEAGPEPLADRLAASAWELRLPGADGDEVRRAVAALLAAESVPVERVTKSGRREVDVREALLGASVTDGEADGARCAILQVVVRHVTPAVRPGDVLTGLRRVADFAPPVPPAVTRLAQGLPEPTGGLADPLAPDRAAADAAAAVRAT